MQLKQAVDSAYQLFIGNDVPSPRLNAELLMQFVLGCERAYLYAHPERELTADEPGKAADGGCRHRLGLYRPGPGQ
jgi:methylase of polypeptide subunit release factors